MSVDTGLGSVDVFGGGRRRRLLRRSRRRPTVDDGVPEITLIQNGLGDVEVSRG